MTFIYSTARKREQQPQGKRNINSLQQERNVNFNQGIADEEQVELTAKDWCSGILAWLNGAGFNRKRKEGEVKEQEKERKKRGVVMRKSTGE